MIVIDAEEDSEYIFDGYKRLQDLIRNPNGLNKDFKVPQIEDHLDQQILPGKDSKIVFPTHWMEGEIKSVLGSSVDPAQKQRVLYLKLSFDPKLYSEQMKNTLALYAEQQEKKESVQRMSKTVMEEWASSPFPHYPTLDQHISDQAKFALYILGSAHGEALLPLE